MQKRPEKEKAPTAVTVEALGEANPNHKESNMSDSKAVAAPRAITVPFHGADLCVIEHNGQPYTPMKPIVTAMGLDWGSQFRKVASNKQRWGIAIMTTPLQGVSESETPSAATIVETTMVGSADGKSRALTCIPVRKVAAWLTTIEPGKVKSPEVRARVIQYQNECDDVLWQYWNDGVAVNPRAAYAVNPGDLLTQDEAETLRLMLKSAVERLPKEKQAGAMVKGWSKLKAHFGVAYREIPRHEFSEAVSIIARHAAEWELVDDEPSPPTDADRIEDAFALATEAAQGVQRAVFQKVMAGAGGQLWRHTRFMVALGYDGTTKKYRTPWVGALDLNAVCMSAADMARSLRKQGGGEWCPTEVELAELGAAIAERQSHMAQRRCVDRKDRAQA